MDRPIRPLAEITPHTRRWTAKVIVTQKSAPRQSQNSPKKYQRFVFADQNGDKIQGIIYDEDINTMQHILELFETYYITGARVIPIPNTYRIVENAFQWIINRATVIEKATDDSLPREIAKPSFVKFHDMATYISSNSYIDLLAIVIHKLNPRSITSSFGTTTIQELVIVNDEKIPLLFTLWDDGLIKTEGALLIAMADQFPIISSTHISVSDYKGLSLCAKGNATLTIEPEYPECCVLREWSKKNESYFIAVIKEKQFLQQQIPHPVESETEFSSLASILRTKAPGKFWVNVTARIDNQNQDFWYMSCANCLKTTTAQVDWKFNCNFCHAASTAKPRPKFEILIADEVTQLEALIFGQNAEQLLGISALDLMKLSDEDNCVDCDAVNNQLHGRRFVMQINKKSRTIQENIIEQYTVSSLSEVKQPSTAHLKSSITEESQDFPKHSNHKRSKTKEFMAQAPQETTPADSPTTT